MVANSGHGCWVLSLRVDRFKGGLKRPSRGIAEQGFDNLVEKARLECIVSRLIT